MKKTQIKDTLRNIGKEKVSFLSIAIIAFIAVAAYLGIYLGSEGLMANADNYYQSMNFRDFELSSNMFLGKEDIEDLRSMEGVADVEEILKVSGRISTAEGFKRVDVVSLTERINTAKVLEGRLPENTKECAVEMELMTMLGKSIGDEIKVTDAKGEKPEYIKENSFTITGIIQHADLYAVENQTPGNRYVMVLSECFDEEALMDSYMKALVQIEKPDGISYYDDEYRKMISEVQGRFDEWNSEREVERLATIKARYEEELKPVEDELAKGEKALKDMRKILDDGYAELKEGEDKLKEGEAELSEAEAELAKVKAQLDAAAAELADGEAELSQAKSELDAAESELAQGKAELDSGNKTLVDSYNQAEAKKEEIRDAIESVFAAVLTEEEMAEIPWAEADYISEVSNPDLTIKNFYILTGISPIDLSYNLLKKADEWRSIIRSALEGSGYEDRYDEIIEYIESRDLIQTWINRYKGMLERINEWDEGHETYLKGLDEYSAAVSKYNEGKAQYEAGLAEYNEALAQYNEGKAQYEAGLAEYNEALSKLEASRKELEDSRAQLKDGEKEYADFRKEYLEGVEELNKSKEELENLGPCHFVALDTRGNAGFVHGEDCAVNVRKIGKTFAMLFIVLGALVIYATVGRIIEEQRILVGTQKALGFFSSEVFRKHLAFGVVATIIGMLMGTAFGALVVQKIILIAHQQLYVTGVIPLVFRYLRTGIIIVLGSILSAFAVFWACSHLLKETAKDLMQPPAPRGRKKSETKRRKGSLYSRLIIRNMLTDWRRVAITMASVAGCTILLVIGFTLQDSLSRSIDFQFNDIIEYRDRIVFDIEASEKSEAEIADVLNNKGISYTEITSEYHIFDSPEGLTSAELITVNADEMSDYFRTLEVKSKELMPIPDEGLLITKRVSEAYNLSVGDTFTIYDANMDSHEIQVAGIFDYYFGKIMIISEEGYEKLFGEVPQKNTFWTIGDYSRDDLEKSLSSVDGLEYISSTNATKERYLAQSSVLQIITYTLIFAAILMAYFVLLNLISMYLNQKKRELTVMRVNGFTTKEVINYVSRESFVTTIFGIIVGLIVGSILGYFIVHFLEQSQFGLIRDVDFKGWLYSALLTGIFAIAINALALRKIKHLKLSDIA